MKTIKWCADLFAECVLKELGISYTVEAIKLSDIDWKDSSENRARLINPVDQDIVVNYGIAMEAGDVFPQPVAMRRKKAKLPYVLAGGNHRGGGAKLIGLESMVCYVIDTDDRYIIDMLPRRLNPATQGVKASDLMTHAIYEHLTYGTSVLEVAKAFHINAKMLSVKLRARKTADEIARLRIDSSKIPDSTLLFLHTISDNERVLKATAELVLGAQLKTDDVKEIVGEIKTRKSEATQLAFIEEKEKELHVVNGHVPAIRKQGNRVKSQFKRWVTEGLAYSKNKTLIKLGITDKQESTALGERLYELADSIERLAKTSGSKGA